MAVFSGNSLVSGRIPRVFSFTTENKGESNGLLSLRHGDKTPCRMAGIDLAGAGDAQFVVVQFLPVGDPARHSADGEHDGVHIEGDADGPQENTAVKIDIRIQIAADEIVVFQGSLFKLQGDIEQVVVEVQGFEDVVHLFFQDK